MSAGWRGCEVCDFHGPELPGDAERLDLHRAMHGAVLALAEALVPWAEALAGVVERIRDVLRAVGVIDRRTPARLEQGHLPYKTRPLLNNGRKARR